MSFFHYWRRREPPVWIRCPRFFSGFTIKVKIYVLFYKGRKFFTGKTNGFFTFLNLYSKKCIGPLKRKVLQVLNRENAWRKHFHDCFRFRLPRKPILGTQRWLHSKQQRTASDSEHQATANSKRQRTASDSEQQATANSQQLRTASNSEQPATANT